MARLRAVLRRTKSEVLPQANDVILIDELEIDHGQHHVLKNDKPLELTVTEYNILNTLVSHLGKVVEKNQLAEEAMSRSLTLFDRSLDMHLSNLRKNWVVMKMVKLALGPFVVLVICMWPRPNDV
jgi:two-component system response regulator CpxR